jgi:hypothetical protein
MVSLARRVVGAADRRDSGHAIEQKQKILGHYVLRSRQMALGAMDLLVGNAGQIRRGFVLLQGRDWRAGREQPAWD